MRKPEGKTPLGRSMRDGKIILRLIFRKWDVGGMEWIELAQDRGSWWALLNAVMNLRVPLNAGNILVASQEGLCSME